MTSPEARHFILGTAGHVDHGKTELVRALTGHETDRLKEEKERGISIELGFAPLDLGEGVFVGVVDVPGHERFVRQMVSGAGGLDMAILLVAADEGVMPQTEEHMEVLRSLRIASGAVVISKCDLASDDTMPLLLEEIEDLVRGSFLQGAPVVETSARTGVGVDELKATLRQLADGIEARPASGPFRLAVDRVFHRQGIGVVITGSCYSGRVRTGDSLELLPVGQRVRVRELQSFGQKCDEGRAGQRLAIALQGVKLGAVRRGDMLATPGRFVPTRCFDARMVMASYADFELKNRERVRIHHGAREAFGRVILLEHERLHSGESALVQVRLESPIVPADEDAFVMRRYSPARVIGGGRVIDPSAEVHRRFDAAAIERIRIRETGDPVGMLHKRLEQAGPAGLALDDVDGSASSALCAQGAAIVVGARVVAAAAVDELAGAVERLAREYVRRHPLQWGIDKEELRGRVRFDAGAGAWSAMLEELSRRRALFVRGNRVRPESPEQQLDEALLARVEAFCASIRERGVAFARRAELEAQWPGPEPPGDAIAYLRERGDVVELPGGGVLHREAVERVRALLVDLFASAEEIGVGDVKDALGLTRKHVIPLLEHFDSLRVTLRRGNARVRGPGLDAG